MQVLDTSRTYHVEDMYAAEIQQKGDGSYQIVYLGQTLDVRYANETVCGTKAVLQVGKNKTKKKLVVTPSPILKQEGPP